jgi:hypothetical protein
MNKSPPIICLITHNSSIVTLCVCVCVCFPRHTTSSITQSRRRPRRRQHEKGKPSDSQNALAPCPLSNQNKMGPFMVLCPRQKRKSIRSSTGRQQINDPHQVIVHLNDVLSPTPASPSQINNPLLLLLLLSPWPPPPQQQQTS